MTLLINKPPFFSHTEQDVPTVPLTTPPTPETTPEATSALGTTTTTIPPSTSTQTEQTMAISSREREDELPISTSTPAGTLPTTTLQEFQDEDGDKTPVLMSKILIPAVVSSIVIVLCVMVLVAICVVSIRARGQITCVFKPCFTRPGKSHDDGEREIGGQDSAHSPGTLLHNNDAYERSINVLITQQQTELQAQQKEDLLQHPITQNYEEVDSDGTASHYERVSGMDTDRNGSGLDRVRKGTVMQKNPAYRQCSNNSSIVSDLSPTGNKIACITKDFGIQNHKSKAFEGAYSGMSDNYENSTLKSRSGAYDSIDYRHVIEMTNNVAYGHSSPTESVSNDRLTPHEEVESESYEEYQYDYAHYYY